MNCPQCGTGLGEGAKACATCGWSKSRRTLWIVLGCVFGTLFLVCCGGLVLAYYEGRRFMEAVKDDVVPLQLSVLHAQIVNYARARGKAPATLDEAASEPLLSENGGKFVIRLGGDGRTTDIWQKEIRFTMNADRTFEVRSAGPNGVFDDPDDLLEQGNLDEDLKALQKTLEERMDRATEKGMKAMGVNWVKPEEPAPPPAGGGK